MQFLWVWNNHPSAHRDRFVWIDEIVFLDLFSAALIDLRYFLDGHGSVNQHRYEWGNTLRILRSW